MKMVKIFFLINLVVFATLSVSGNAEAAEPTSARSSEVYLIGPGDILDISVWQNPDLTKSVTVLPDGKIAFPLVGELQAANKTREQLSDELRLRLKRYVPEALHLGRQHSLCIGCLLRPTIGRLPHVRWLTRVCGKHRKYIYLQCWQLEFQISDGLVLKVTTMYL